MTEKRLFVIPKIRQNMTEGKTMNMQEAKIPTMQADEFLERIEIATDIIETGLDFYHGWEIRYFLEVCGIKAKAQIKVNQNRYASKTVRKPIRYVQAKEK